MEQERYNRVLRRLVRKAFSKLNLWQYFEGYDPLFIYNCDNVFLDKHDRMYIDNYISANMPNKFRK